MAQPINGYNYDKLYDWLCEFVSLINDITYDEEPLVAMNYINNLINENYILICNYNCDNVRIIHILNKLHTLINIVRDNHTCYEKINMIQSFLRE